MEKIGTRRKRLSVLDLFYEVAVVEGAVVKVNECSTDVEISQCHLGGNPATAAPPRAAIAKDPT